MNVSFIKGAALCGLSLLLAGAGSAVSAQTYHHARPYHHARTEYQTRHAHEHAAILRQKARYARAVSHGHPRVAERAHLRAAAIRHHLRTQRATHMAYHR